MCHVIEEEFVRSRPIRPSIRIDVDPFGIERVQWLMIRLDQDAILWHLIWTVEEEKVEIDSIFYK